MTVIGRGPGALGLQVSTHKGVVLRGSLRWLDTLTEEASAVMGLLVDVERGGMLLVCVLFAFWFGGWVEPGLVEPRVGFRVDGCVGGVAGTCWGRRGIRRRG